MSALRLAGDLAYLDPALDRVLSGQAPPVQIAAQRVMARCLSGRIEADGNDAWRGSSLTGDGYPVEFAIAAGDPQLRFTCEPSGRAMTPAARLQCAGALVGELGAAALPGEAMAALHWAQQGAALRYGGWLGVRISAAGKVSTKLYAELAADRPPPLMGDWLPRHPDIQIQPRMLGLTATGQTELYLRTPSLRPGALAALLAPCGMAERKDEVLDLIAQQYGAPLRGRLPGSSVGISYAPSPQGCTVTLYFFARALWGGDGRIRSRFAALIADPAQRQTYLDATAPLAQHNTWATRHGLVGLVLHPGHSPAWVIGFRPAAIS